MEINPFDVVVVSAFGRSDWLATEIKAAGLNVGLVDVSHQLGVWPPEDVEGPFGLFMSEKFSQSYLEALSQMGNYAAVDSGFTVWTPEGPLELKSSLTNYRLQKLGLRPNIWEDLTKNSNPTGTFAELWPLHLSRQLGATTYFSNREAMEEKTALPITNSFLTSHPSRAGLQKSLAWVKSKDVWTATSSQILDLALSGRRQLTGLELKGEAPGFFRFENLVWALTSEETYFLSEKIGQKLFPQGALESTWSWLRYRLKVEDCLEVRTLPRHVCLIDDVMAPWTHDNLIILQKTALTENIDIWGRIPTVQRFNIDYLKNIGKSLEHKISARMPLSRPQILNPPHESTYTYKELGPPRFPIFTKADASTRNYVFFKNLHRDGPESWAQYSRDDHFAHQTLLKNQIVRMWQQKQLKTKETPRD